MLMKLFGVSTLALIMLCGFLYIQNLRKDAALVSVREQLSVAEHNLKVAEEAVDTLKKMEAWHEVVENAPSNDVANFLRYGVLPNRSKEGASVPTPAGGASVGKSPER